MRLCIAHMCGIVRQEATHGCDLFNENICLLLVDRDAVALVLYRKFFARGRR
jgi:hypothetical protein